MSIEVIREVHDPPGYVAERLTAAGGRNRFGEPNFRVVWGWSRLNLIGGEWPVQTSDGAATEHAYRWVPKYPFKNRWIVEGWVAPEKYGDPWAWSNNPIKDEFGKVTTLERELGPYPWRGEYEDTFVLETPNGQFLQLTPTVVEYLASAIRKSREQWNPGLERKRLYAREARKEEEYVNWCMNMMDDNATWSYTPHSYLPAKLKEKLA
jgi:hypothetical protein